MLDVHRYTRYVYTDDFELQGQAYRRPLPGSYPKGIGAEIVRRAKTKLDLIDAAATLDFLRSPPGNRLEALQGARAGQHSIRVNDQWRIGFRWEAGNARDVEFCDYH